MTYAARGAAEGKQKMNDEIYLELDEQHGEWASYASLDGMDAVVVNPDNVIVKQFYGETAHTDAARLAFDLYQGELVGKGSN